MNKPAYLKDKIKFIDARNLHVKNGNHNDLGPNDIETIKNAFLSEESIEGFSNIKLCSDLIKNNSNLTVSYNVSPEIESVLLNINEEYTKWIESKNSVESVMKKLLHK